MSATVIRDARLPEEEPVFAGFIDALQRFEHAFEPDRRIDAAAGADYLAVLLKRADENEGRIFVAERAGEAVGWAVFVIDSQPNFVVEDERRCGWIAELFVAEQARGDGVGRALMAACEAHARDSGLKLLFIGVHAKNGRAERTYRAAGFSPYALHLRKYL